MAVLAAARVDSEPDHSRRGVPARTGGVAGKIEYCTDCHGPFGQGYHGYLTMPRLAGQTPEYIDKQLRNFADRSRERNLFINMARVHGLSPDLRAALGEIYFEGVPQLNVVPCAACHGPAAEGIRNIPRLAGLSYAYLKRRLAQWGEGYHAAATPPMPRIASKLPPPEIDALASFLSFVR
jgi:cytochrome c553